MSRYFFLSFITLAMVACVSAAVASRVFPESRVADEPRIPVTALDGFEGCAGPIIPVVNNNFEQAVVEQTNQIRMEHGLAPLKRVETLDLSSRFHAADMSVTDYFDHNSFGIVNGELVQVCDTWDRIETYYTNWLALAENIAAGQRLPEVAMDGWMNSPDHRHNILSDAYWEIGVGYFEGGGEYRHYWVQNFGRTDGRYPLILDGERAFTTSPTVDVYIYGDWDEMRIRVNDSEWSDWMPFNNSFRWNLPNEAGLHTVTANLRGYYNFVTTSDTIELVP
jgi:uncharacterized protein YkwD